MNEIQDIDIWEDTPIEGCFSEKGMAETKRRLAARYKHLTETIYVRASKIPSRLKGSIDGRKFKTVNS